MRILIDLTQIPRQKAGVGVYSSNLVHCIKPADSTDSYYAVIQDDEPAAPLEERGVVCIRVPSRYCRKLPIRFLMEQIYLPFVIRKYKIDVLHSLHYSFPLLPVRAKKIVTIHDLTFFLYPELHTVGRRVFFRLFTRLASKRADGLIFVSQSTAADFSRLFGACTCATVIPLGQNATRVQDHRAIASVTQRFSLPDRYVLFVGTIEPRKNLDILVRAFRKLKDGGFEGALVITGKRGWGCETLDHDVQELGLAESVIFTGFVDDDTKWCLLSGASAFVYPSLYEGFGIPVLEALSIGVPTVTSAVSAMPEITGDAAVLIDPRDTAQLAAALHSVCNDEELRRSLVEKGKARSQEFTWSRVAEATRKFYARFNEEPVSTPPVALAGRKTG